MERCGLERMVPRSYHREEYGFQIASKGSPNFSWQEMKSDGNWGGSHAGRREQLQEVSRKGESPLLMKRSRKPCPNRTNAITINSSTTISSTEQDRSLGQTSLKTFLFRFTTGFLRTLNTVTHF